MVNPFAVENAGLLVVVCVVADDVMTDVVVDDVLNAVVVDERVDGLVVAVFFGVLVEGVDIFEGLDV